MFFWQYKNKKNKAPDPILYSDYLLFLNRVEVSSENSPSYDEMQTFLHGCLEKLKIIGEQTHLNHFY